MQKEETQLNTQNDFWFSIIENCENSIVELKREICKRREAINKLETGLNGFLTFRMTKLFKTNPDADISSLYSAEELKKLRAQNKSCGCCMETLRLPDLRSISVFTMKGNDLSLMKYIKDLAREEKALVDNISRLRKKEMALNEAHREVKTLLSESSRKNTRSVSEELLVNTNCRLLCENERLKEELNEVRNCILEQMAETQMVLIKTIAEQLEINEGLEKELSSFEGRDQVRRKVEELSGQVEARNKRLMEEFEINKELRFEIAQCVDAWKVEKREMLSRNFLENGCIC